jgi:hypothetical protein
MNIAGGYVSTQSLHFNSTCIKSEETVISQGYYQPVSTQKIVLGMTTPFIPELGHGQVSISSIQPITCSERKDGDLKSITIVGSIRRRESFMISFNPMWKA